MTIADKIRNLSDENLAKALVNVQKHALIYGDDSPDEWLEWLKQEAETQP